jgi:hypothetical protein
LALPFYQKFLLPGTLEKAKIPACPGEREIRLPIIQTTPTMRLFRRGEHVTAIKLERFKFVGKNRLLRLKKGPSF